MTTRAPTDAAASILSAAHAIPATLAWPADQFYWAEIDGMGWSGSGTLPPGMLPSLADELPVAIESVHAVATPGSGGRVLICACPRDRLADLDPSCVELKPAALPPGFDSTVDLASLNLLVGEFEPIAIRVAKRSRHLLLAATLVLCCTAISFGLIRRSRHADAVAAQAARSANTLLADFTTDRKEEILAQHAKAMQTIAEVAGRARPPVDAAAGLESLLRVWPASIPAKPLSISVAADGLSFGVVVDGDPAPFLQALKAPDGFVLDEPRINTTGSLSAPTTRLTLHAHPANGGSK